MVLYRVYSEPVLSNFYSTLCSRATLFQIVAYCLILVPPAFIAYATNDFWLSVSSYREQPDVTYLNQCIVLLGGEGGQAVAWSSFPDYLSPPDVTALPLPPNITFTETDTDGDGKNDVLDWSADFSSSSQPLNVSSVQLLLFFSVQLSRFSSVTMQSLAYVSLSWPSSSSVSLVWVGGDLVLSQRDPLAASGRSNKYNTTLLNTSSHSWEDYQPSSILSSYGQRDLTTVLFPVYPVWGYGTGGGGGGLTLQTEIRYPEQTLLYRPGFWQRLKWAWLQYLALALVFWWALKHVQSFVFQNQIVLTIKPHSD